MDILQLVSPSPDHEEQVMAFKEVADEPGLGQSGVIQRYWITL